MPVKGSREFEPENRRECKKKNRNKKKHDGEDRQINNDGEKLSDIP